MFTQNAARASQISKQQAMIELVPIFFILNSNVDILSTFVEHNNDRVQHIAGIMGREAFCV